MEGNLDRTAWSLGTRTVVKELSGNIVRKTKMQVGNDRASATPPALPVRILCGEPAGLGGVHVHAHTRSARTENHTSPCPPWGAPCAGRVWTHTACPSVAVCVKSPWAPSLLRGHPPMTGDCPSAQVSSLSHTVTIFPKSHCEWLTPCPGIFDIHSPEACHLYGVQNRCHFIVQLPHTHNCRGPCPCLPPGRWSRARRPSSPTRPHWQRRQAHQPL